MSPSLPVNLMNRLGWLPTRPTCTPKQFATILQAARDSQETLSKHLIHQAFWILVSSTRTRNPKASKICSACLVQRKHAKTFLVSEQPQPEFSKKNDFSRQKSVAPSSKRLSPSCLHLVASNRHTPKEREKQL